MMRHIESKTIDGKSKKLYINFGPRLLHSYLNRIAHVENH